MNPLSAPGSALPPADTHAQQQAYTLYVDHHAWLRSWLRKRLGNAFDAADLAQDTFLRLLSKPPAISC